MKAVIAQANLLTAYGLGIEPLWNGLMSRTTAVNATPTFSTGVPTSNKVALIPGLEVEPGSSRARAMLDRLLKTLPGKLDPQTPLILATTVCEIERLEQAVLHHDPHSIPSTAPTVLLAHLKQSLGLTGSATVMSSACASSSAALTRAAAMVCTGNSPAVLVVTCDAVSEFVYSGFSALLSLCDTPARPFDASRCGLSLGEAAAWMLVTREDSPLATDGSAVILGWTSTSDAVHMTAPDRTAGGLSRTISGACAMAGVSTEQVRFIAAHGTATLYNDAMELLAFRNCFPKPLPTFSIKGGTGHTLAAAGLIQLLVSVRAMQLRLIPPTVGLSEPDAAAVGWVSDHSIAFSGEPIALSTNSGFGGVNTAILLGLKKQSQSRNQIGELSSMQVRSIGWVFRQECGSLGLQSSIKRHNCDSEQNIPSLIDRPVKYLSRMTPDARCALVAVSLAIKAAGWDTRRLTLGIVGSGYDGCLTADAAYFADYVATGRSLGRANLFIYTLPTSAISEVAIALNLTGPTLHVGAGEPSISSMLQQARSIVQLGEAQGVLCIWSDGASALSLALGAGESGNSVLSVDDNDRPLDLCRQMAGMAQES